MNSNYIKKLPRWHIKEPNFKEFEDWKQKFLMNTAVKEATKKMMIHIGELMSEREELIHLIEHMQPMTLEQWKQFVWEIEKKKVELFNDGRIQQLEKRIKKLEEINKIWMKHYFKLKGKYEPESAQNISTSLGLKGLLESSDPSNP